MRTNNSTLKSPHLESREAGFTIIELMIVVAIISVIAMIAIPTYLDYTTRSKVGEGLYVAGGLKTAVGEYYVFNGDYPTSNGQAGLAQPTSINGKYIAYIAVCDNSSPECNGEYDPGVLKISYDNIPALGTNNELILRPVFHGGSVSWTCTGGNIIEKFRPRVCQ